jgi:hypothetical protein
MFHHTLPMPNDYFEVIEIVEETVNKIVRCQRDLPSYITNAERLIQSGFDS